MATKIKEMSDEEILRSWIKNEKQFDLLDGIQRIRHQRIELEGIQRDLLFEDHGVIYPDPTALA